MLFLYIVVVVWALEHFLQNIYWILYDPKICQNGYEEVLVEISILIPLYSFAVKYSVYHAGISFIWNKLHFIPYFEFHNISLRTSTGSAISLIFCA